LCYKHTHKLPSTDLLDNAEKAREFLLLSDLQQNASWCCRMSSTASSSVSFLTCPRISVPLATSTPGFPRHDAIRLPSPDLGPRLNLVPPRSIPFTTSFLVSCTPSCAYSPRSLASFPHHFATSLESLCIFIRGRALSSWAY